MHRACFFLASSPDVSGRQHDIPRTPSGSAGTPRHYPPDRCTMTAISTAILGPDTDESYRTPSDKRVGQHENPPRWDMTDRPVMAPALINI